MTAEKDAMAEAKAAMAKAKALRPWFKKKRFWLLGFIVLTFLGSVLSGGSSSSNTSSSSANTAAANSDLDIEDSQEPATSSETAGQVNARRKAESYLDVLPFSKRGLIKQLNFEGFSDNDATYAVNALTVDWNQQAAKKAKSYLDIMGFSRSGLIKQLSFDGFTQAEAEYGVSTTGL